MHGPAVHRLLPVDGPHAGLPHQRRHPVDRARPKRLLHDLLRAELQRAVVEVPHLPRQRGAAGGVRELQVLEEMKGRGGSFSPLLPSHPLTLPLEGGLLRLTFAFEN